MSDPQGRESNGRETVQAAPQGAAAAAFGTDVNVTGGELRQRARLERMHTRLLALSGGFCLIFGAVGVKLALATMLAPMAPAARQIAPQVPPIPKVEHGAALAGDIDIPTVHRATITDRNGQILAISLPLASVYANPQEMIDPAETVDRLASVLPKLDRAEMLARLQSKKQFVYLARGITPDQELRINDLGIPGIYFEPSEKRHYPLGRTATQVMGAVDIDDHGVAGVERAFDRRLTADRAPLRLSLDIRVQAVAREELQAALTNFKGIGACSIVMDVNTGEILAMVSLPDYDANEFGKADPNDRFNRCVTGMYEPGSTFKLQTAAMALQDNVVHVWDRFSSRPIHVGRFTISDMKTDHFAPWLSLPEVLAYSSNPASAHIALDVGAKRQREWLKMMGFLDRVPVELPEAGRPVVPGLSNWGQVAVMTIGFGHGVAESPLAIVRGTAATTNGGFLLKPTVLARPTPPDGLVPAAVQAVSDKIDDRAPDASVQPAIDDTASAAQTGNAGIGNPADAPGAERVISPQNAELLRRLLRLDVTKGTGKTSEVEGYLVGGKTGTAEKVGANGRYLKHLNIAAFTSVFPMNRPRYAVYVMIDSPVATKETHGWTTAAWVAAPVVRQIISRAAPMLGLFPKPPAEAAALDAALAIPLEPSIPSGTRSLGPGNDPGDPGEGASPKPGRARVADTALRPHVDAKLRHEAAWIPGRTAADSSGAATR